MAVSGEVIFKVELENDGIDLPSGSQPVAVFAHHPFNNVWKHFGCHN